MKLSKPVLGVLMVFGACSLVSAQGVGSEVSAAACEWKCRVMSLPAYDSKQEQCGIGNSGEAWISVPAPGDRFNGDGYASDGQFFCEIEVNISETGYKKETCYFKPITVIGGESTEGGPSDPTTSGCKGKVEVTVKVEAWGEVDLQNADCEAAALGLVETVCNLTPTATAKLMNSQGATGSESVLDVSWGVGFNISTGNHEGTKDDHKVRDFDGQGEVDFFTYTTTCEVIAACYADGGWGGFDLASCSINELRGEGTTTYVLSSEQLY